MAKVTLQVLDGADRGKVYHDLITPITIGREDGNSVQLNDERISRFHIKIQKDQDKIVLTDLESTNGTKVNGEGAQLRILRYGDVITVGRSVLLYGTKEQIVDRLDGLKEEGLSATCDLEPKNLAEGDDSSSSSFEMRWADSENLQSTLHIPAPPELPVGLSPGQAAQFSEILEYLHLRSRQLVLSVQLPEGEEKITLNLAEWQGILDLQTQLAKYLRKIGEPDEG